jgi:uncharacterized protein (UPF0210 family)
MYIRSVTCFVNVEDAATAPGAINAAGGLAGEVRAALEEAGYPVQTARLATQPLSHLPGEPLALGRKLAGAARAASFEYLSLGPVLADAPDADLSRLAVIPDLIRSDDALFASVYVARQGNGLHLRAIRQMATIVRDIAITTDQGFGNLRLTMLANVAPHAPFFPSAYHDGGPPALALAIEAADLVVEAFGAADSLENARVRLIAALRAAARDLVDAARPLAEAHGVRFAGLDFSPAPFPRVARSIGTAVERLGVDGFGAPGTLFVAALLTDTLRQALQQVPTCGFNGLMLPVLEDATLAARSQDRLFTVNDLLLYSAVCGTGLDTVPLPGNVSEEELAGILLDVAALALRLNKPLTARLMPVPGLQAGDRTQFDFEYFENARVLDVKGRGSPGLFRKEDWLAGGFAALGDGW